MATRGSAASPMANRNSSPMAKSGSEGRPLASSSPSAGRVVPRPPQVVQGRFLELRGAARSEGMNDCTTWNCVRVSRFAIRAASTGKHSIMSARNTAPSMSSGSRSYSAPYFGRGTPSNNVPRPTGRVMPASRSYSSGQGGYSSRSYSGRGYSGYSGSRGYSAGSYGASRGYSGGSYGASSRGYSASRGYSGSPYGGPSRGYSGRSYSAPSSHGSARSAAAADTPGHRGASAGMPARAAPMAGAALIAAGVGRTVEAAATVVIANL